MIINETPFDSGNGFGKHLVVKRGAYTHHGISTGDDHVIHYSGLANGPFRKTDESIRRVTLAEFAQRKKIMVRNYQPRYVAYSPSEIVHRAKQKIGTNHYNLVFRNCEHFACWCVTGISESEQVKRASKKGLSFLGLAILKFLRLK